MRTYVRGKCGAVLTRLDPAMLTPRVPWSRYREKGNELWDGDNRADVQAFGQGVAIDSPQASNEALEFDAGENQAANERAASRRKEVSRCQPGPRRCWRSKENCWRRDWQCIKSRRRSRGPRKQHNRQRVVDGRKRPGQRSRGRTESPGRSHQSHCTVPGFSGSLVPR